jgi:hypothetical protein
MRGRCSERMTRQEDSAVRGRRVDETVAQREATQQPACAIRRREGGAVRGRQEDERTARREAMQQPDGAMRR